MKILLSLTTFVLCGAVSAQSPLLVQPAMSGFYGWNPPAVDHQSFFDMTVNTTITLQALNAPLYSPVGTTGSMEVWLTNPGTTTFVGNTTNAAVWSMAASGPVVANGTTGNIAALTSTSCQSIGGMGLVLQPGTYGVAIRYLGVANLFAAVPTVPQTFSNAELTVTGGTVQAQAFVSVAPALPPNFLGWNWYGSIDYALGVVPHACADSANYGVGCYSQFASFYQEFLSAAAASTALTGNSISLIPNSQGGYDVVPGLAPYAYVAPSASATPIAATDDGEALQTLTVPIPAASGPPITELYIHSNGIVSTEANAGIPGNNTPDPNPFLNAPATAWYNWHNFNPTEAGSGPIMFEEAVLPLALTTITWLNVESYPTTAANPSTWQLVFDPSSGIVTFNWVTIDSVGNSGVLQFDDTLVGFSPGGASPDPAPTDLAALIAGGPMAPVVQLPATDVFPLSLSVDAKPIIGTTINLTAANETTNPGFGVTFVCVVQVPAPGLDLGFLGAPGCPLLVDINTGVGNTIENVTPMGMTVAFPLPNNPAFAGLSIYAQAGWLDAAANALAIITSNGVRLLLGNF